MSVGYDGTTHTLAFCGQCAIEMRQRLDDITSDQIEEAESEDSK